MRRRPAIRPPWETGEVSIDVRREYARGLWAYAVGTPAEQHPDYRRAVRTAEREGWNPWWIRSVADADAVVNHGCRFDLDRAQHCRDYIESMCNFPDGPCAGQPYTLADYQFFDFFGPLMGWVKWSDRHGKWLRRFLKGSNWRPRKNSKSTDAAALELYLIDPAGWSDARPRVFVASTDKDTAKLVFEAASAMVAASDDLSDHLQVIESRNRVICKENGGALIVLAGDARGNEGKNASCVVLDEVHVLRNRRLYAVLRGSFGARVEPLFLLISTAGVAGQSPVGQQEWARAEAIRSGAQFDHTYYACQYFADRDLPIDDPQTYIVANPGYGLCLEPREIAGYIAEARTGPAAESEIRRYHLNQWANAASAWLPFDLWMEAADPGLRIEDFHGQPCWEGLDLAPVKDTTALARWFEMPDGCLALFGEFWVPKRMAEERDKRGILPSFLEWGAAGQCHLTPGDWCDYEAVIATVLEDKQRFRLREIGVDPNNAQDVMQRLVNHEIPLVSMSQTYATLNGPTKEFERRLRMGGLKHPSHEILNWNASVVEIKRFIDKDYIRPVKPDHERSPNKVDGILAAVMGLCRFVVAEPEAPTPAWLSGGGIGYV